MTDDYVEPDFLLLPCFQIDPTVELKDIPTTGEEYLLKVINERKNCETVTKCKKDLSKFASKQTIFAQEPPQLTAAPPALKPTTEWQNIQVADFSEIRMYLSQLQLDKSKWPKNSNKANLSRSPSKMWNDIFETETPTLTCLLGLKQCFLDSGLQVIINQIDKTPHGETIDHTTGEWIYAIMACLELPLLSDTISTLRDLARKCAEIRSHINPDDENAIPAAAPLNIFICLVSKYFRQADLTD